MLLLRAAVVACTALLLVFPLLYAQDAQSVAAASRYAREAAAAREVADPETMRARLLDALELLPGHPTLLHDLAVAHALAGDVTAAASTLERLAAMGLVYDLAQDDDLAALRSRPELQAVQARFHRNADRIGDGDPAFRLPDRDFIPEGVAFDARTRRFFVGSVHLRRIVAVDSAGTATVFGAVATDSEGSDAAASAPTSKLGADPSNALWSVLGIAADTERRLLWVCTAALPETRGVAEEELRRSRVVAYDLDTGALRGTYAVSDTLRHVIGDLAIGPEGEVYVSASDGAIYVIGQGSSALEPLVPAGRFVSPQGIVAWPDGRRLYVADYALGILRIDPASGATSPVTAPEDAMLLGIDGLARHDDTLIAIQNGTRPHRVLRLRLNAAGDAITAAETLEANHPAYDEPTLGTVVEDTLFYVANSQWGAFRDGALPPADELEAPVILRLRLKR